MDKANFDFDKHKNQIIYKVVEFGQLSDWEKILTYYGKDEIKKTVLQLPSLDVTTLSFLSIYFDIDKTKFRCCLNKLSVQNFWAS